MSGNDIGNDDINIGAEGGHTKTPEEMLERLKECEVPTYDNGLCASGFPPDIEAPLFPELREGMHLPGGGVYSVGMIANKLAEALPTTAPPLPKVAMSFNRAAEHDQVASLVTDHTYKSDLGLG